MIKQIIELAAGASVGMVIDSAAKNFKPTNITRLGKAAYKVGTFLIGVVVTETCLDWGKKQLKGVVDSEDETDQEEEA